MNQGPVVYLPKKGPNSYSKKNKKSGALKIFVDIFLCILVAVTTFIVFKLTNVKTENQEINNPDVVANSDYTDEGDEKVGDKRAEEFNSLLNTWVTFGMSDFREGVVVYDLDNNKTIGEIFPNERFQMKDLYSLFVAYEGYKRFDSKTLDGNAESASGRDISTCLDLMIRESDTACMNNVLEEIGKAELEDSVVREWGLSQTNFSDSTSTPSDISRALSYIYKHKDLSNESWKKFQDSMLKQPETANTEICEATHGLGCDFRQGLPSGFSSQTKVYNKTGWDSNGAYWVSYNDAAIVEIGNRNRHFSVVMMTEKFPSSVRFKQLGELIEESLNAYISYE